MKYVLMALQSPEGKTGVKGTILGILVASVGGYLLRNSGMICDIVVILGGGMSMIGTEQLCQQIIRFREADYEE